ncbi:hypothetical protein BDZ45DRAFT_670273, partial [Acephala macrosclerotiorum]
MRFIELIVCDVHGDIIHAYFLPSTGDPLTFADAIYLQGPPSPGHHSVRHIDNGIAAGLPIPALPLAILSTYLTFSLNRLIAATNSEVYIAECAIRELELQILPILSLRERVSTIYQCLPQLAALSKECRLAQVPMREELSEMLRRLELVRQQQSLLLQRGYQVLEKLKLVLQRLELGRQMVISMLSISMQMVVATGAGH